MNSQGDGPRGKPWNLSCSKLREIEPRLRVRSSARVDGLERRDFPSRCAGNYRIEKRQISLEEEFYEEILPVDDCSPCVLPDNAPRCRAPEEDAPGAENQDKKDLAGSAGALCPDEYQRRQGCEGQHQQADVGGKELKGRQRQLRQPQ